MLSIIHHQKTSLQSLAKAELGGECCTNRVKNTSLSRASIGGGFWVVRHIEYSAVIPYNYVHGESDFMTNKRLDVRLDTERRRKLGALAAEQGAPISEMVRRLIDRAYEETLQASMTG